MMTTPLAIADHDNLFEYYWDFVGRYEIDDSTGNVSFTSSGELELLACSAGWSDEVHPTTSISGQHHAVEIRVTELFGRYEIVEENDGSRNVHVRTCLGAASTPLSSPCAFSTTFWAPTSTPMVAETFDGWQLLGNPVEKTSASNGVVLFDENRDLRHEHIRPRYNLSGVPFSGRLVFGDPDGSEIWSSSYIAGKCAGDSQVTPRGCGPCEYSPTEHALKFGARPTKGDLFVPPVGPVGSWQLMVHACDSGC